MKNMIYQKLWLRVSTTGPDVVIRTVFMTKIPEKKKRNDVHMLNNRQWMTVVSEKKGHKQGEPAISSAYWLEKICKPQHREGKPKQRPWSPW